MSLHREGDWLKGVASQAEPQGREGVRKGKSFLHPHDHFLYAIASSLLPLSVLDIFVNSVFPVAGTALFILSAFVFSVALFYFSFLPLKRSGEMVNLSYEALKPVFPHSLFRGERSSSTSLAEIQNDFYSSLAEVVIRSYIQSVQALRLFYLASFILHSFSFSFVLVLFLVYLGSGSVYHLLFLLVVLSSYSLLSTRIAEWMGAFILAKSFFTVGLFRYFATLFAAYSPHLEPVPAGGEDDNPPGFGGPGNVPVA